MIGNLTIDKSSSNLSYFLKSIKIIADNGGSIYRPDFVSLMADFMGTYAAKDGKENRTPYNKLKLVQYFGFAIISVHEGASLLSLTPRGTILSTFIAEDNSEEDPELKYYIEEHNIPIVRQLFIDSILYDSFGQRNCGAERSETDIEPVKVIVRLLYEKGLSTSNEIFYAIYSLNGGKEGSIKDCIEWDQILRNIDKNREDGKDYEKIFESWGLTNFVRDPKILNILSNSCVDVIRNYNGEYNLSPEIDDQYFDVLKRINIYHTPLCELIISENNVIEVREWVLNTIVNKFVGDSSLMLFNLNNDVNLISELENFVLKAISTPKKNYHLVLESDTEDNIWDKFDIYKPLLVRIEDLYNDKNGWSLNKVSGKIINTFPSNLNIVVLIGKY